MTKAGEKMAMFYLFIYQLSMNAGAGAKIARGGGSSLQTTVVKTERLFG